MSTYEISKSSLLSLKAEILRKQQELSKVQKDNKVKIQNLKKNTPLDLKNKGVEQRESRDISDEEINLLKQSRTALEAKAKLYERLSKEAANMTEEEKESHWRYLVRFDKKASDSMPNFSDEEEDKAQESEEEACREDYEPAKNPDEEWVEYTDCLGRTRTCLRKDLEYLKSKDAELRSSIDLKERGGQILPEEEQEALEEKAKRESDKNNEKQEDDLSEQNELLSADMRREILRRQWEKEEDALRNKKDIHYQDILFNEARTHGVGYYSFSKDEEVRAQQQEALRKLREETQEEQKKAQDLKALREKQLAERAKAARNRRRARMGLPPEEDDVKEVNQDETPVVVEDVTEKLKEKEKTKEEKEKEKKRRQHVRPWDKGKEGVREHREYTQDEWVEKKRKERPTEFAPPTAFHRSSRDKSERDNSDTIYENKSLYFSTKKPSDKRNKSKESINPYKRRNASPEIRTPIVNELSDDDASPRHRESSSDDDSRTRGKGVEIAPPPTFDYYGPSGSKKHKVQHKKENIEDSISAGLEFLRQQAEQRQKPNKRDDDMFIM